MLFQHNHIVLIGFKHVGKSVIGKHLAHRLNISFIDLDHQIEFLYENKFNKKLTCRQIMQQEGEEFFRGFEIDSLRQIMSFNPSVISLGGGAIMHPENQSLIQSSIIIHITAPPDIVFERILSSGRPAFFNPEEDLLEAFNHLWNKRRKDYENLPHVMVENNGSVEDAVHKILMKIHLEEFTRGKN